MENMQTEQSGGKRVQRTGRPVLILCLITGGLLAAYLILCGAASGRKTFYPNYTLNGVEIGGLTAEAAQTKLTQQLPQKEISLLIDGGDSSQPAATVTLAELGYDASAGWDGLAQRFLTAQNNRGFFERGFHFLKALTGSVGGWENQLARDDTAFRTKTGELAQALSRAPVDTAFELKDNSVQITKAADGVSADTDAVADALETAVTDPVAGYEASVKLTAAPAKTMTVQEIHDAVAAEVKNAGYDVSTGKITAEQTGAEFDTDEAQKLLDEAKSGDSVDVPAKLEYPKVTAEELKSVLFRDLLGSAKTHVSGSSGRISNVKLASRAVSGTVLNSGDTFSYNGTVGQRTIDKGYSEAPAYVQGQTVDEVGGGVCQPSSTLYLATLNSNLQIVERAAHRYVPAYIAKGMDATVSWGGPDYRFRNDTDYPIKIVATYSGGYLTMQIFGTKTDSTRVKMTNKVLSTTEWKTVTQDDATLAAGTQEVKVTPYTGYKVESYRNLYDRDGNLISSKLEAVSNYKVRDKIVLVGTKKVTVPASGSSSGEITEPTPGETEPGEGETPVQPTEPTTPTEPVQPAQPGDETESPVETAA